MKSYFLLLLSIIYFFTLNSVSSLNATGSYQPTQIHISFGNKLNEIIVTWVTTRKTQNSFVDYGINGLIHRARGKQFLFRDGGTHKRKYFIHRVSLRHLKEDSTYEYRCGSDLGWSTLYSFDTPLYGEDWSPRFAIFGDLGAENAQSLPRLQIEAEAGKFDAIFHVGDFAYDLDSKEGKIGDKFMNQIEPIAARVPYMTVVGNHEERYNFSHYRKRFSMPGDNEGLWYSFNMGPVHFVIFSTEVYYFKKYGTDQLINQYKWLKKDLKEASSPKNREKRPWIITMGHRPMYCSNDDHDDCTKISDMVRVGIRFFAKFGLEDLFYKYRVDIEIWAHEHSYERTWPLYKYKVYNGTEGPYVNPGAPIHVITGSAGCQEHTDNFKDKVGPWSAFRSSDYGYTHMKVHNQTHIHFEQISDDQDGLVIDRFWVIKDSSEPFPNKYDEPPEEIPNVLLV